MRTTRAIGGAEARNDDAGAGIGQEMLRPRAFDALLRSQPHGARVRVGSHIIDVPMLCCSLAEMPPDARAQSARTKGAAHVEVQSRRQRVLAQRADGAGRPPWEVQAERVGARRAAQTWN